MSMDDFDIIKVDSSRAVGTGMRIGSRAPVTTTVTFVTTTYQQAGAAVSAIGRGAELAGWRAAVLEAVEAEKAQKGGAAKLWRNLYSRASGS